MREYKITCHECDSESLIYTGDGMPEFCPICGSKHIEIQIMGEEALWELEEE